MAKILSLSSIHVSMNSIRLSTYGKDVFLKIYMGIDSTIVSTYGTATFFKLYRCEFYQTDNLWQRFLLKDIWG